MKIITDLFIFTIFTVGIVTALSWLLSLPGKLYTWVKDRYFPVK